MAALAVGGCTAIVDRFSFESDGRDAGSDAALADGGDPSDASGGCSETCTGETPICDRANDRCVGCLNATQCDDGEPCTVDRCGLDNRCASTIEPECYTAVYAGSGGTCAVRGDRELFCFGHNLRGRLAVPGSTRT